MTAISQVPWSPDPKRPVSKDNPIPYYCVRWTFISKRTGKPKVAGNCWTNKGTAEVVYRDKLRRGLNPEAVIKGIAGFAQMEETR